MLEILRIENACFASPLTEDGIFDLLKQRNCIGMVAEHESEIVGFMIYDLRRSSYEIRDFAVTPWAQRCGVGSQMIRRLRDKLSSERRNTITVTVRETNLSGQLFLRNQDFEAVSIVRSHYDDTSEDAYRMRYQLSSVSSVFGHNRIADYSR